MEDKKENGGIKALRKRPNPGNQPILMFPFDPILQQRDVMNKLPLPLSERADLSTEDLSIPEQPNIPTCQNDHFHEKRLSKTLPCSIQNLLHIISTYPLNL
jgi:hypothetical protein